MFEGWGYNILKLMRKREPIKDDILPDGGTTFIEGWTDLKLNEGFGGH